MPAWPQVEAQLRGVLMLIAGYLVGNGVITEGQASLIIGAVLALGAVFWAFWVNRPTALVQAASTVESVEKIEMKRTVEGRAIDAATNSKVTTSPS